MHFITLQRISIKKIEFFILEDLIRLNKEVLLNLLVIDSCLERFSNTH